MLITATPQPSGSSLMDFGDGTGEFEWTPDFSDAGTTQVTFAVSDFWGETQETISIVVTNVNRSPGFSLSRPVFWYW